MHCMHTSNILLISFSTFYRNFVILKRKWKVKSKPCLCTSPQSAIYKPTLISISKQSKTGCIIKLALKSRERAKIKRAIDQPEQEHPVIRALLNVRFRLYYWSVHKSAETKSTVRGSPEDRGTQEWVWARVHYVLLLNSSLKEWPVYSHLQTVLALRVQNKRKN